MDYGWLTWHHHNFAYTIDPAVKLSSADASPLAQQGCTEIQLG